MGSSSSKSEVDSKQDATITAEDVFEVRHCLISRLPAELANLVLDIAEYWPKYSFSYEEGPRTIRAGYTNNKSDASFCFLLTPKMEDILQIGSDTPAHVKRVKFKTESHDQGWCSQDVSQLPFKYQASYTWFEVAIIRSVLANDVGFDNIVSQIHWELDQGLSPESKIVTVKHPANGSDVWHLQSNVRAQGHYITHEVVWETEDTRDAKGEDERQSIDTTGAGLGVGFVRSLEMGDRIAVLARAQYPGWANSVKSVEVEIFFSV